MKAQLIHTALMYATCPHHYPHGLKIATAVRHGKEWIVRVRCFRQNDYTYMWYVHGWRLN